MRFWFAVADQRELPPRVHRGRDARHDSPIVPRLARRAARLLVVLVEPVGRARHGFAPLAVAALDLGRVLGRPLRGHVPVGAQLIAS